MVFQLPPIQQVFGSLVMDQKLQPFAHGYTISVARQTSFGACSELFPIPGQLLTNSLRYEVVSEWEHLRRRNDQSRSSANRMCKCARNSTAGEPDWLIRSADSHKR